MSNPYTGASHERAIRTATIRNQEKIEDGRIGRKPLASTSWLQQKIGIASIQALATALTLDPYFKSHLYRRAIFSFSIDFPADFF